MANNQKNLTAAYQRAHFAAADVLERLREELFSMPAPDSGVEINWDHVGTVNELARQLTEVLKFVK